MHILVIDGGHVEAEFREKFGPAHEYHIFTAKVEETHAAYDQTADWWEQFQERGRKQLEAADIIFNFSSYSTPAIIQQRAPHVALFEDCSTSSLISSEKSKAPVFGFCGLPTLLNRRLLEVSLYDEADREKLAATCAALGTDYRVVADRVGLVTPRVICQIINEACFTVQEGTATMQDVDLGMKLGTSYPRGPFAWANAIGVERVYAVLEALWQDTHDERYKVCPLLKRQALRGEPFAV